LAKSYQVAPDGLSISFELRTGVTFQDGAPFNATAAKANLDRAKTSTSASLITSITSVEAPDPTHVVVRLKQPDPTVLEVLAGGRPGMMTSPAAFNNTDLALKPVGAGPYLPSGKPGGSVVYQRWDGYWDKTFKSAKTIMLDFVADNTARYNGLRSGSYDA